MIDFRDGNSVVFFVSRSDNIFYQDFLKLPVEVRGKNEGGGEGYFYSSFRASVQISNTSSVVFIAARISYIRFFTAVHIYDFHISTIIMFKYHYHIITVWSGACMDYRRTELVKRATKILKNIKIWHRFNHFHSRLAQRILHKWIYLRFRTGLRKRYLGQNRNKNVSIVNLINTKI